MEPSLDVAVPVARPPNRQVDAFAPIGSRNCRSVVLRYANVPDTAKFSPSSRSTPTVTSSVDGVWRSGATWFGGLGRVWGSRPRKKPW